MEFDAQYKGDILKFNTKFIAKTTKALKKLMRKN